MNRRPRPASGGAQGRPGTHVARKRFGQHFLTDEFVIGSIVDAIDPQPGDALVEIGPGLGALTNPVVARSGKLTVIELDRDIARELRLREELSVVESDVLKVDFSSLPQAAPRTLRVIGNLPYNISTPLLFHLLDHADAVRDMHFMLQKEVVERMCAGPGDDHYGRLSVMLAAAARCDHLFDVGPECFDPPPRVDSAIVRVTPQKPAFDLGDAAAFERVVTAGFAQRRKTLGNALRSLLPADAIRAAGIDPETRAERVSPAGFAALAAQLGPGR